MIRCHASPSSKRPRSPRIADATIATAHKKQRRRDSGQPDAAVDGTSPASSTGAARKATTATFVPLGTVYLGLMAVHAPCACLRGLGRRRLEIVPGAGTHNTVEAEVHCTAHPSAGVHRFRAPLSTRRQLQHVAAPWSCWDAVMWLLERRLGTVSAFTQIESSSWVQDSQIGVAAHISVHPDLLSLCKHGPLDARWFPVMKALLSHRVTNAGSHRASTFAADGRDDDMSGSDGSSDDSDNLGIDIHSLYVALRQPPLDALMSQPPAYVHARSVCARCCSIERCSCSPLGATRRIMTPLAKYQREAVTWALRCERAPIAQGERMQPAAFPFPLVFTRVFPRVELARLFTVSTSELCERPGSHLQSSSPSQAHRTSNGTGELPPVWCLPRTVGLYMVV